MIHGDGAIGAFDLQCSCRFAQEQQMDLLADIRPVAGMSAGAWQKGLPEARGRGWKAQRRLRLIGGRLLEFAFLARWTHTKSIAKRGEDNATLNTDISPDVANNAVGICRR